MSGPLTTLVVAEETEETTLLPFDKTSVETLLLYPKQDIVKPVLRDAIATYLDFVPKLSRGQRGITGEQKSLKEISDDQERIRKNLERVPQKSDAFKRYLMKFDTQETQIRNGKRGSRN